MKPKKPTASSPPSPPLPPRANSRAELRELQRLLLACIARPIDSEDSGGAARGGGQNPAALAERLIRPSRTLSPFDRLEIYHRQYWLRLREALSADYPALERLVGSERFGEIIQAYLLRYPPASPLLREVGSRLPRFLREEPAWAAPLPPRLLLDLARFEWAKIAAFHAAEDPLPRKQQLSRTGVRLFLQPHVHLLDLRYPVDRITPEELSAASPPSPDARRIAIHRQGMTVYHKLLPREAFYLLASFAKGRSLAEACARTAKRFPSLTPESYRDCFREWSALGWLTASPSRIRRRVQPSKNS